MNTMFLQMLPILIFVIVDAIFSNTVVSIASAVLFAIFQMIVTFSKTGAFDYFILVDVILITGLGLISIFSKNDLFFKVKPAIIEAIMVLFILGLYFAPDTFVLGYFERFMPKNMAFTDEGIVLLKKMLLWVSLYTVVHIAAILYTALHSSRRVWALVSGPGYYFIFIPIMLVVLIKKGKERKKR